MLMFTLKSFKSFTSMNNNDKINTVSCLRLYLTQFSSNNIQSNLEQCESYEWEKNDGGHFSN